MRPRGHAPAALRLRASFGKYNPRGGLGGDAISPWATPASRVMAPPCGASHLRSEFLCPGFLRYFFGIRPDTCLSLPHVPVDRRAGQAPPSTAPAHPCSPHRSGGAGRGAGGRRAAARTVDRDRRAYGKRQDHAHARHRRVHGGRTRVGGVRGRAAHARRARLGAPGRRRGSVDHPAARRGARGVVRRRPPAQRCVRARGARRRAGAHQVGRGAIDAARARVERRLRRARRANGRRLTARRRGAIAGRAHDTGEATTPTTHSPLPTSHRWGVGSGE